MINEDILNMVKIYNTYSLDWMGDEIKSLSDLTRHHIVKKEDDGIDDISNYALLTSYSHHFIHYLEIHYNKEYNYINSLLLELNQSNMPPTSEYYEKILPIIKKVKKSIKNKRRKRN